MNRALGLQGGERKDFLGNVDSVLTIMTRCAHTTYVREVFPGREQQGKVLMVFMVASQLRLYKRSQSVGYAFPVEVKSPLNGPNLVLNRSEKNNHGS